MTFSDFFDYLGELDWLAVLVGALAIMVLGWLWYGPLFGKAWSKATGISTPSGMPPINKLIGTAIYSLVFNLGISYSSLLLDDIEHALVFGGMVIGILIIGSVMYSGVVWEQTKPGLFIINLFFWALAAAVAIYVQGLIVA